MMEFDAINHIYKIDDMRVPSVTELLPKQSFFVSPERLEETRQEGEDNHNMVRLYYDSICSQNGCQTFGNQFLEEYHRIVDENKTMLGNFIFNEKALFSRILQYAGTPDTVYENAIIDLKRSHGNEKIIALQFAGYNLLLHENGIPKKKKWLLIYGENGKLKIKNIYNDQAETIFLTLLKRYKMNKAIENYLKS